MIRIFSSHSCSQSRANDKWHTLIVVYIQNSNSSTLASSVYLFRRSRGYGKCWSHESVAVVDLCVLAQQLLLALLVGPVSSHLVTVLFGLQKGNQVDSRPHLFTSKLIGLSNTANQLVPAVAHDGAHAEEKNSRSEALGGEISLVLDGLVPAPRGHILGHDGRFAAVEPGQR